MGGKGGPFRLDSGHPIHQISPVDKSKISEEEEAIRRSIAKAALNEKLNQLNLNELEMSKYLKYKTPVTAEINQLRAILDATRAKDKERNWLKQKSQGEIDDTRLVEGLTGDSRIYKLRGKQEQMQGGFQENPKKMSFVVDVSGSMYRFNSQDKRLDRLVQVCIMIMEALEGFQHKFSYEIVGHSGDSPEITFVSWEKPANTIPERLLVVEKMIAHSQYCASGDFTVEATSLAVKRVIQTEADDYFVFVFSDANLARYGISTSVLNRELTQEPKVNSSMIFIASPMNEAERIKNELPPGKAFICLDPQDLPHTFKQILSQSVKED
uniref:VWFA domain-containing protein n=1 Tax=Arcella intermedia TaxID=1963864 RepID=A0A6B2L8W2_9EUKA